jgi:hypothetical protein
MKAKFENTLKAFIPGIKKHSTNSHLVIIVDILILFLP